MSRRSRVAAPHLERLPAGEGRAVIALEEAGTTPILREYRAAREQHPGAILLARLGDFYEMFGEDAERAAPILGVSLTGRSFGSAGRVPMCGVPHHAATGYIRRLLEAGLRVAIWDQVEAADAARGLVRREVTRVISPGTVVDDEFLEPGHVARCLALTAAQGRLGLAALDASTGELQLWEMPEPLDAPAVAEECERLGAAELLLPEGTSVPPEVAPRAARSELPPGLFDPRRGAERLLEATGTAALHGLGVGALTAAHGAAGALLAYCARSRLRMAPGFLRVRERPTGSVMRLDPATRRNLELLGPLSGSGPGLFQLLDRTRTPMGARLLHARLQEPLLDPAAVAERLDAVGSLVDDRAARSTLRTALLGVRDLERLVGRCVQGISSPRDLAAVRDACRSLPDCTAALRPIAAGETAAALADCTAPRGLAERLGSVLVDDPPPSAREGGAVRSGADAELDRLHAAAADARAYIAGLEDQERVRTGIRSLRVGYNRVFGYYIEIPNAHGRAVPADYVRKQTLVGAERYITPALKEQESVVLTARERATEREGEVLRECAAAVAAHAPALLAAAAALAVADVAQSLAETADELGWCRPVVDGSSLLEIEAGRHPLVERALPAGSFVPNDCALGARGSDPAAQVVVLTGPNMAGKSTYLRQVALVALLAQVGSFVPAARVRLGACDRIFTRVGAQDDLAAGLSTFMVEMTETAAILGAATARSLVVLDEIGRGTSTYDGLAIAQAVVEHLHAAPQLGCRTLFATHYHELTALAARLPGVRNARVDVLEEGDGVTFLHRIVEGGADRSYGIHVARLAGLPPEVLARARDLLTELECERERPMAAAQLRLPLQEPGPHPLLAELAELDLDGLTPLAALNTLAAWRARLDR